MMGTSELICYFLHLGGPAPEIDSGPVPVTVVHSATELQSALGEHPGKPAMVLVGVTRDLMVNYLALAALFFNPRTMHLPIFLVSGPDNPMEEAKGFLFGRRPYPIRRITEETITDLREVAGVNRRNFTRIPVEFVAFVTPEEGPGVPVVCRNISWNGTYFETRADLEFDQFSLVLRSRLHRVDLPAQIVRRWKVGEGESRYGYGVRFLRPLPLSLVHYMYAKYQKDRRRMR